MTTPETTTDPRHARAVERIIDDLLSRLLDPDGEPWHDVVEDAMNEAWDRLGKLEGPDV